MKVGRECTKNLMNLTNLMKGVYKINITIIYFLLQGDKQKFTGK